MPGHLLEIYSNLIQIILYDLKNNEHDPDHVRVLQDLITEVLKKIEEPLLLKLQTQLVEENPSTFQNGLIYFFFLFMMINFEYIPSAMIFATEKPI